MKKMLHLLAAFVAICVMGGTVRAAENVAQIGETQYETLQAAIEAAGDGVTIALTDGTHTMPNSVVNKNITITGGKDAVVEMLTAVNATGSTINFNGVTVKFDNDGYEGLQHSVKVTYTGCTHIGTEFLYAPTVEFTRCTFDMFDKKTEYAVWTYGAKDVKFTDCVFNTNGKAILVYTEAAHQAEIKLANCEFKSNGTFTDKAAVELGQSANGAEASYDLSFTECTADEKFAANNTESKLWGNKNDMTTASGNSGSSVTITTDGVTSGNLMPKPVKIGESEYDTLQAAINAATVDANMITLVANIAESVVTVAANQDVVIDLGGKTVTGDFMVKGKATIKNGTILNSNNTVSGIESAGASADLTVENLTVTSNRHALRIDGGKAHIISGTYTSTADGMSCYAVNVGGDIGTTLVIDGGVFRSSEKASTQGTSLMLKNALVSTTINGGEFHTSKNLHCVENYGTMLVKGGVFNGSMVNNAKNIEGGTFDVDPSEQLVEGYMAVAGENVYTVAAAAAKIGETYYLTLADAIAAAEGETTIELFDGTHTMPNSVVNKNITIKGSKDAVVEMLTAVNATGSTVNFDGVTVKFDNDFYEGLQHSVKVTYTNCTHIGTEFCYAETVEYSGCTFEMFDETTEYAVWTYGAKDVKFTNCVFNTNGKAILVYNESKTDDFVADIELNGCQFNSTGTYTDKAAVELGQSPYGTNAYNVEFTECTTDGNFHANNTDNELWGNKNNMTSVSGNGGSSVVIDGKENAMPKPVVAKIGETSYTSLQEAITAAKDGETVTQLAEVLNEAVVIENKNITLSGVNITVENAAAITIKGRVELTLEGENVVTSSTRGYAGVQVNAGAELTIVAASTGSLTASGGVAAAGIGSNENSDAGTITINGGTIVAVGGSSGAGIGGSNEGDGGVITITGGTVTASCNGKNGAGIGGGLYGKSGAITISGGTVTATGGEMGPGIGSGYQTYYRSPLNEHDKITITGADTVVNATGGDGKSGGGAGIGSGAYGLVAPIEIKDGATVTAKSTAYGAGIGGGSSSTGNSITIDDATVYATGGSSAGIYTPGPNLGGGAGIGSGADRITFPGFTIVINKSTVEATGGNGKENFGGGAGIGGGSGYFYNNDYAYGGDIDITDSEVTAIGGTGAEASRGAAGIGGGGCSDKDDDNGGYSGNIVISGGKVTATGAGGGAGIGGGGKGGLGVVGADGTKSPATITVSGSDLAATGGADGEVAGAGLGAGNGGTNVEGCTVSVSSGTYSSELPAEYIAEGYEVENVDGKYVVVDDNAVASVTAPDGTVTKYKDVTAALKEATGGNTAGDYTVTLLKDCTSGIITGFGAVQSVILDLNGKTLTIPTYFYVANNDTLIIKDGSAEKTGKIVCTNWGAISVTAPNGTLIVESGTLTHDDKFNKGYAPINQAGSGKVYITGGSVIVGENNYAIGSGSAGVKGGVIEINGGTVTGPVYLAGSSGVDTVDLNGGKLDITFEIGNGFAGTITKAEGVEVSAPDGYKWGDDGKLVAKVYVAQIGETKYETLQAAIDAAQNGETVKQLVDVVNEAVVIESKDITLDGVKIDTTSANAAAITISGTVNLTLVGENAATSADNFAGVQVEEGAELTITDVSAGTLSAIGGHKAAGIGGGNGKAAGTITINGGTVNATGGANDANTSYSGAGIGGGNGGNGGTITINGGKVTANGNRNAAGIGGGYSGDGGVITINGGEVNAYSVIYGGAGIGGGHSGDGGVITITDGVVVATGSEYSAGIGGSSYGKSGAITISGGHVTAKGVRGAGIGTGESGRAPAATDKITISGKDTEVYAYGGGGSAGIGGAWNANNPVILIDGAKVEAYGGERGTGIGAGQFEYANPITIQNGANVRAIGGIPGDDDYFGAYGGGAGIGSGSGIDEATFHGTITITDSTVYAQGGSGHKDSTAGGGAGIGSAGGGSSAKVLGGGGKIIITNSDVTAIGGNGGMNDGGAAGIGGGSNGGVSGDITIVGGTVKAVGGNGFEGGTGIGAGAGLGGGDKGGIGNMVYTYDASGSVATRTVVPAQISIDGVELTATGGEAVGDEADGAGFGTGTNGADVDGSVVNISCGTYSSKLPEEYLADGFTSKDNNNGTYGVARVFIAQVGETKYYTLQEAINAANGETVTLLKDVAEKGVEVEAGSGEFFIQILDKPVVVDLGGFTLKGSFYLNSGAALTIDNGAIETLDGNASSCIESVGGKIVLGERLSAHSSVRHAIRVKGGTAEIKGGTYVADGNSTYHVVNVSHASTVTINGGTFTSNKGNSTSGGNAVMIQDAASKVAIKGGTFTNAAGVEGCICAAAGLTISGGTFDTWAYDKYLAEGCWAFQKYNTKNLFFVAEKKDPPKAIVEKIDENPRVEVAGIGTVTLESTYNFEAPHLTAEEAWESQYSTWHADFEVSVDKDIPANSIVLAGNYGNYGWLAYTNPDPITAGTTIRLLKDVGNGSMTYYELCTLVKEFKCGVTDVNGVLDGVNFTVKLNMYQTQPYTDANPTWNNEVADAEPITSKDVTFELGSTRNYVAQFGAAKYETVDAAIEAAKAAPTEEGKKNVVTVLEDELEWADDFTYDDDVEIRLAAGLDEATATAPGGYAWVGGVLMRPTNWLHVADTTWYNADQTAFTLTTEEQLAGLAKLVNGGTTFAGKTVTLGAAMNLAGLVWPGIGIYAKNEVGKAAFQGTFDGANKTVSGMTFADNTGTSYAAGDPNNYRGLFNQIANGAVVENLTVSGDGFGTNPPSGEYGGAMIVGHAYRATIQNCVAEGTISGSHNTAGVVVRIDGSQVLECTNNAAVSGSYNKLGGIIAIDQAAQNSGATSVVDGCVNNGTITSSYAAATPEAGGIGGIIGWAQYYDSITVKNCTNNGEITGGVTKGQIFGASMAVTSIQGVNKGLATTMAVNNTAIDGLNFATVADDDVATYTKTLTAGNTYLVTAPNPKPVIKLAAGKSITFDQTLATIDPSGITAATILEKTTDGNLVTYKAKGYVVTIAWPDETTTAEVADGEAFTLAAKEIADMTFVGWSGAYVSADAEAQITVTGDATITANYLPSELYAKVEDAIEKNYEEDNKFISWNNIVNLSLQYPTIQVGKDAEGKQIADVGIKLMKTTTLKDETTGKPIWTPVKAGEPISADWAEDGETILIRLPAEENAQFFRFVPAEGILTNDAETVE